MSRWLHNAVPFLMTSGILANANPTTIEVMGTGGSVVLDQGESTQVSITAEKWKKVEGVISQTSGDLDVMDGSQTIYKLVEDIPTSQRDYSYYYMLLWKKPSGSGDTPPYMYLSGRISTGRTNDIGVNSISEFYVSSSHSARTYTSSHSVHHATNAADQLQFVEVPYEGNTYVAMMWDHNLGAGFAKIHMEADWHWLDTRNKADRVDSNFKKMLYSCRENAPAIYSTRNMDYCGDTTGPLHVGGAFTNEFKVAQVPNEADVLDGSKSLYHMHIERSVSQADYSHFYLILWKQPLSSVDGARPPFMAFSGTVNTYRTNDIGVNSVNEFYVSRSHSGYTYATSTTKHAATNAAAQMTVEAVTLEGTDYIALHWNHRAGAGFASLYLGGTFKWLSAPDSSCFDSKWLTTLKRVHATEGALPGVVIETRVGPSSN